MKTSSTSSFMTSKIIRIAILLSLIPLVTYAQKGRSQIMILGTSHLHQMDGFEPSMLDRVIAKLDTLDFEVIAIEKMPGELLYDIQSRGDSSYNEITKGSFGAAFLSIADTVQKAMDLSFLGAGKNIQSQLEKSSLNTDDRKDLVFNYLATTELPSAALQYDYINDKSVFAGEFERYIADILERKIASNNEYYSLAAPLAKRENINKLEPIDNFQDEALLLKYYPGFIEDYTAHAEQLNEISALPVYQKLGQLTQECVQANDLSNLYSFLNSDEYKNQDFQGQWAIWLETNFSSGSDRARYCLWEMRNLQIAANIMDVAARNPGKKILVIIGASHKGFLEKYLEQVSDLEILRYD